jgi:hypothetical protein
MDFALFDMHDVVSIACTSVVVCGAFVGYLLLVAYLPGVIFRSKSLSSAEDASGPPDIVITLVHGTVVLTRGKWTLVSSPFRVSLAKALHGRVRFLDFRWSGRNTFHSRREAALKLGAHLRQALMDYPSATHFVIGHSHGGSVSALALADEELASHIGGLVCLATPFLHVNESNSPRFMRSARYFAGSLLLLVLINLAFLGVGFFHIPIPFPGTLFWAVVFSLLVNWIANRIFGPITRRAYELVAAAGAVPSICKEQLLILRHYGDEATGFITAGYVWAWAVTYVIALVTSATTIVQRAYQIIETPEWEKRLDNRAAWVFVLVLLPIFLFGAGWWTILADRWPASKLIESAPIFGLLFSWKNWGLAFLLTFAWYLLTMATILGLFYLLGTLVLVPWFFAVALPAVILIGPELIFTTGHLNVSVESAPPGQWIVNTPTVVKTSGDPVTAGLSLNHSLLYQNSTAIDEIATWIAGVCLARSQT